MRSFPEKIIQKINTNPDFSIKAAGNFGNDAARIASLVAGEQEYRDYIAQLTAKELFDTDLEAVKKITTTEADPVHSIITQLKNWDDLTLEDKKAAAKALLEDEAVFNKIFPVLKDDQKNKRKSFFERLGCLWLQKNYPNMNSQQAEKAIGSYNQLLSSLDNNLLATRSQTFFKEMMNLLVAAKFEPTLLLEEKVMFGADEAGVPTLTSTIQVSFQNFEEEKIAIAKTQYHYKLGESGFDLVSAGCDEPLFYSLLTGENKAAQQPENAPVILLQLMRKGCYQTAKTESEKSKAAEKIKEIKDSFNKNGEIKNWGRAEVLRLVRSGEGLSLPQYYVGLQNINLENVSFIRVKPGKNTSLKNGDIEAAVDFTGSDLRGVNFAGADLRCVNFTSALIDEKTNFSGAKINEKTDFTGTKLTADQILQLLGLDKLLNKEELTTADEYVRIKNEFEGRLSAILKSDGLPNDFKQKIDELKKALIRQLGVERESVKSSLNFFSPVKLASYRVKKDDSEFKNAQQKLEALKKCFGDELSTMPGYQPEP